MVLQYWYQQTCIATVELLSWFSALGCGKWPPRNEKGDSGLLYLGVWKVGLTQNVVACASNRSNEQKSLGPGVLVRAAKAGLDWTT